MPRKGRGNVCEGYGGLGGGEGVKKTKSGGKNGACTGTA